MTNPDLEAFLELRVFADTYYHVQQERIAIVNRLQARAIPAEMTIDILDSIRHTEKMAKKAMQASFRHAAPWVVEWLKTKETVGLGPHLMARLLGVIGHPIVTVPHHWEGQGKQRRLVQDPLMHRKVSSLWAFCGLGYTGFRRQNGLSVEANARAGSTRARMLVHLLSESCIRQTGRVAQLATDDHASPGTGDSVLVSKPSLSARHRSPYRDLYDLARIEYSAREDWTLSHQHKASLRLVGKAILKDLYVVTEQHLEAPNT